MINKTIILPLVAVLLLTLLAGCINTEQNSQDKNENLSVVPTLPKPNISENNSYENYSAGNTSKNISSEETIEIKDFSNDINKLTTMFLKYYNEEKENVVFSPYNIYEVSSMLYYGSNGKTKQEFEKFFGYDESVKLFLRDVGDKLKSNKEFDFDTANGIWIDKEFSLKDEYRNEMKKYFDAQIEEANFKQEAEKERESINKWVEDKTNDRIKRLFPKGSITSNTKVVLAGTIYLNAKWKKEFDKKAITEKKFYTPYNEKFVEMLYDKGKHYYYENDVFSAVKLPYSGEEISMVIVLPKGEKKNYKMKETVEYLEDTSYGFLDEFRITEVKVMFPKFKFEFQFELKNTLKENGFDKIFKGYPDFSRMVEGGIVINTAIHKAYIDVNEKGTEATAATGYIGITSTKKEEAKEFIADHPFLFFIIDEETNSILFAGKINNPKS